MTTFLVSNLFIMVLTILCAALAYRVGVGRLKQKAAAAAEKPHSLVNYGIYAGLWTLVPAVILALVWGLPPTRC